MKLYAEITKRDDDARIVTGYASSEALDCQGEVVKREAMQAALPDYMKFANIREMHGNAAAGIALKADYDDKGLLLEAHIVDDSAWKKVKAGVYKGFSIGGRVTKRDEASPHIITGLDLSEISLVDRPANPEALINVFKAHDGDTTDVVPLEPAVAQKVEPVEGLEKARTKTQAEADKVQAIHDHAASMGAKCDSSKADVTGDLAKARTDVKAATQDAAALRKSIATLNDEKAELKKAFDDAKAELDALKAKPAETKAVLKVVGKADDVGTVTKVDAAAPTEPEPEKWFGTR